MKFEDLYDYQQDGVIQIRKAIRAGNNRVLYQLGTGAGKTVLATYLAYQTAMKNKRTIFLVHRQELVQQSSETFKKFGIKHGIIAPGFTPTDDLVQIASVFTVVKRLKSIKIPDVVIIDETHHAVSSSWTKCLEAWKDAIHLGITATPERLDGKGLNNCFDVMVQGPPVDELIKRGKLCSFEYFAPPTPIDMSQVKSSANDYNKGDLNAAVDKPTITGCAVEHYKSIAMGKRAVVFCASIKHAHHVAEQFCEAGVNATSIDGTDNTHRSAAIKDFKNNKIQVITNCDIISEGFDLPALEVAILLRPTQSLSLHLQQAGRALRVDPKNPNKKALILDHVGNIYHHGLLDEARIWSLQGKKERKRLEKEKEESIQVRQCEQCFGIHATAPICPLCGFIYKIKTRDYKHVNGKLVQIDNDKVEEQRAKQARNQIIASAGSYEELKRLEQEYKYRPGWAKIRWQNHWKNKKKRRA